MCPASAGGFTIVRIFALPLQARPRRSFPVLTATRRGAPLIFALIAVMLAACGTEKQAAPAAPSSLLTEPLRLGTSVNRPLAVLPPSREDAGEMPAPIIVRGASPSAPALPAPSAPGAAVAGGGDVTLNFSGADIRDVIAAVLGETLKLNYVIDPDVAGPVTFNVSRPLQRDEVLPALEAVLESRGITLVQSDGIVRVMLAHNDGKPRAAVPIGPPGPGAIGERIELFPVRYVAATDILHVLEKILPPGQVMLANEVAAARPGEGHARRAAACRGHGPRLRCRPDARHVRGAAAAAQCRGGDPRGRAR